jgi:hypothetical protein
MVVAGDRKENIAGILAGFGEVGDEGVNKVEDWMGWGGGKGDGGQRGGDAMDVRDKVCPMHKF